jgi:hypothetical protein
MLVDAYEHGEADVRKRAACARSAWTAQRLIERARAGAAQRRSC